MELLARGVAGWRITVRHDGPRADVLDALARTGAAFLRTAPEQLEEAIELGWLPGVSTRVSVVVGSLTEALDAIAAGAVDLVVGDWDPDAVGRAARRHRPPRPRRAHRPSPRRRDRRRARRRWRAPSSPPGSGRSTARARRGRATTWAPGGDEPPPVPARRLSAEWEDAAWRAAGPEEGLGRLDPDLARILERVAGGHRAAGARDRAALPRPRAGGRGDRPGRRHPARAALRRDGHLRRQPQHQLHQPVLLPLRLLRLLARAQEPQPARRPLHPERARGRAPLGRGLGAGRHRGLPAGRHPPRLHRRLLRRRCCAASRRACPRCTSTASRRSRSGRAPTPSG